MLSITPEQRRALRAQAHGLKPVVIVSENGLTDSVMKEIERSLAAHELIKIRVFGDDRTLRETQLTTICEAMDAAPVQHIGKLLVVWRPAPEDQSRAQRRKRPIRRTKRSFQGDSR